VEKLLSARLGGPQAPQDSEALLPDSALPIVETMMAFADVSEATMSHTLDGNYRRLIAKYNINNLH
jgi:hypothetical protein